MKVKYRDQGFLLTSRTTLTDEQKQQLIPCSIVFHPPDNRHRDIDNLLAACKPLIDGIAKKLDINDRNLRPITIDMGPKQKDGLVSVELSI